MAKITDQLLILCRVGRSLRTLTLAVFMVFPGVSYAQSAAAQEPAQPSTSPAAPAIKVMAIGGFTAKADPSILQPVLLEEARATVRLYLDGKIDQWFVRQDRSGVVLVLNVADANEASTLLGRLPLGAAGMMEFQYYPLEPFNPLRALLNESLK